MLGEDGGQEVLMQREGNGGNGGGTGEPLWSSSSCSKPETEQPGSLVCGLELKTQSWSSSGKQKSLEHFLGPSR